MGDVTLYCEETPGLKLGPGVLTQVRTTWDPNSGDTPPLIPGDVIEFRDGFARFDEAKFPKWRDWIRMPGTPPIRIVEEAAGEATSGDSVGAICPVCERKLATDFALKGHLRSHAPSSSNQRVLST